MKKLFIVANWKSNKTYLETEKWFQGISNFKFQISNKQIIVCPSFSLLSKAKSLITNYKLPITLGAQDISPFGEGAYTGEVNGKQIKEFADYVIIGHSERRKNFGEIEEIVDQKIQQAQDFNLTPILCISDTSQIQNTKYKIPDTKMIVAYEPLFAIGSGKPDTPKNADDIAMEIKQEMEEIPVLYGGSVTSDNIHQFTSMENINGVLVGKASLDAQTFISIINNA